MKYQKCIKSKPPTPQCPFCTLFGILIAPFRGFPRTSVRQPFVGVINSFFPLTRNPPRPLRLPEYYAGPRYDCMREILRSSLLRSPLNRVIYEKKIVQRRKIEKSWLTCLSQSPFSCQPLSTAFLSSPSSTTLSSMSWLGSLTKGHNQHCKKFIAVLFFEFLYWPVFKRLSEPSYQPWNPCAITLCQFLFSLPTLD